MDLTADNISCNTLSINGEPFNPSNPSFPNINVSGKTETQYIEAVNRNLAICDSDGNGNPGTDPNSGYERNKFWGYTEFYSMPMIKRRQNPGDYYNFFGPCMQITNEYQKTEYLQFGKFRPAYSSTQFGHDFNLQVNSSMSQYIYFGPGNYKNKLVMDANGLIASELSSFCILMPCLRLDVNANGVVPVGGVSCNNGVLRIVINSFNYIGPIPTVGQYVSVKATPSTLSLDYAVITSVTTGTTTEILASAPSMPNAVSTAVESVYFGPKITSNGTTTISVSYNSGPLPEVGQHIKVTCTNAAFNTASNGNPITAITVNGDTTILTYSVTSSVPTETAVVTSCSLKFDDPSTTSNPKGILSNIGIHNSDPQAPCDILGNVICRDAVTKYPVFRTVTENVSESQVLILDSTVDGQKQMVQFDCENRIVRYKNPALASSSSSSLGTFFEIDNANSLLTTYNSTTNSKFSEQNSVTGQQIYYANSGATKFMLIDSNLARMAIGSSAVDNIASYGGFVSSSLTTFTGLTRVESPASFVCGAANQYFTFRVDNTLNRVSVLTNNPQFEFHVSGESFRQYPHCMALLRSTSQSIPSGTTTAILWNARDTITEYGPVGVRTTGTGTAGDPFVNASLGLTLNATTGRFTYATMGTITKKMFNVSAMVIYGANATGYRQSHIEIYNTSGTMVRALAMDVRNANTTASQVTSVNLSSPVLLANGESFAVVAFQSSGAAIGTYATSPVYCNIQITHV